MNYKTPIRFTCPDCGAVFMAHSPKQKRCPACQARVTREKRREIVRRYAARHSTATHEQRHCRRCCKAFVSTHKNHHYCSTACQIEAKQGAKHVERRCRRCGKPFVTRRANQKYCTHDCMVRWHRERIVGIEDWDKKAQAAFLMEPITGDPCKLFPQLPRRAIARLQRQARIEQGRAVAKKTASVQQQARAKAPPKPKAEPWQERVARELQIPDPDARFAAARKWTPKERKYAQKLAMRGMGWRGPAYGI